VGKEWDDLAEESSNRALNCEDTRPDQDAAG
jgi:hypothetical protein